MYDLPATSNWKKLMRDYNLLNLFCKMLVPGMYLKLMMTVVVMMMMMMMMSIMINYHYDDDNAISINDYNVVIMIIEFFILGMALNDVILEIVMLISTIASDADVRDNVS
jgi:hypothetical protein